MSDLQAELFEACKAFTPAGHGVRVLRHPVGPIKWDVYVFDYDHESDDDPMFTSMFTIESRQWHQWSNAERAYWLKVRMDDCVANIQNAREGLLE